MPQSPAEVLADPVFKGLPDEERRKVLLAVDPMFSGLAAPEQDKVLGIKRAAMFEGQTVPGTEQTGLPGVAGGPSAPGKPMRSRDPQRAVFSSKMSAIDRGMGGREKVDAYMRDRDMPGGNELPVDPGALQQTGRGLKNLATGGGEGGRVAAASDVIEGGLGVASSTPGMAMIAPGASALLTGVGTGMAAQRGAQKLAEETGATPEWSRLAGNVAGVAAGGRVGREKRLTPAETTPATGKGIPYRGKTATETPRGQNVSRGSTSGEPAMPEPVASDAKPQAGKTRSGGNADLLMDVGGLAVDVATGRPISAARSGWRIWDKFKNRNPAPEPEAPAPVEQPRPSPTWRQSAPPPVEKPAPPPSVPRTWRASTGQSPTSFTPLSGNLGESATPVVPRFAKMAEQMKQQKAAEAFKPTEAPTSSTTRAATGKTEGAPTAASKEYQAMLKRWRVDPASFPGAKAGSPWVFRRGDQVAPKSIRTFPADQVAALAKREGLTPEAVAAKLKADGWLLRQ